MLLKKEDLRWSAPLRNSLKYLLMVHLTALAFQSVLRGLFYVAVRDQLTDDVRGDVALTATAFLRGLWFDNVISCYLLLPALVVVLVTACVGRGWHRVVRPLGCYFGALYTLVFMATAANIPYFAYFTKILNSSIWNWASYGGTTLGMMFGESSYYLYIAYFFLFSAAFCLLLRRYGRAWRKSVTGAPVRPAAGRITDVVLTLALCGLCLFGIRGRVGYNPIKISAAYFCDSPILNQLGVNPMFCLLQSTLDDLRPENARLHLMNDEAAVRNAQRLLGRQGLPQVSPIADRITPEGAPTGRNVVLVLMESMSADLTGCLGGTKLTPAIDSLARGGRLFANCYSAGNHTNHGLYATLYSFPSILKRNAMKGSAIPTYDGLPTVLREAGYSTLFFMTHESQYDNMNAFLRTNGYGEIYAQENYPAEKVANHFGVQDDFLFDYALPVLRRHAATGRPFFATLLTISNHPPYVLPASFRPRSAEVEQAIVEYADWAIGRFMQAARREKWFENTIFVFVGDHGKMVGQADCELPASYNHVPLIFYGADTPRGRDEAWAGQVDIAPTILGLLRLPYVRQHFGIDLLREQRPCIFYSADNTVAARDAKHLYVYNPDAERAFCYSLAPGQAPQPCAPTAAHQSLRDYCFSMLQATEVLVEQGKTRNKAIPKGN